MNICILFVNRLIILNYLILFFYFINYVCRISVFMLLKIDIGVFDLKKIYINIWLDNYNLVVLYFIIVGMFFCNIFGYVIFFLIDLFWDIINKIVILVSNIVMKRKEVWVDGKRIFVKLFLIYVLRFSVE